MQATSRDFLSCWLSLCKDVLASSVGTDLRSPIQVEEKGSGDTKQEDEYEVKIMEIF